MKNSRMFFLLAFGAVLIFSLTASRSLAAQGEAANPPAITAPVAPAPAHPTSMEGKTAEQYYKNIKVFKGVPASQILPAMQFIAASLGVRCTFCHVMEGKPPRFDFAKDDKRTKLTARKMVQMMDAINQNNFHGRMAVTCATCHNGHPHPENVPALAMANAGPPGPPGGRPAFQMMPMPPKVLSAYYQAIGGAEAARKVTTRVLKGTLSMGPNRTAPVEIYEKAPNKFLSVMTLPNGRTMEQGTNGTVAWMSTPRGAMPAFGPVAEGIERQADFYGSVDVLNLKQRYPRMRVRGTEKIGDREAYILEAHAVSGGAFERLYFDKENGLLLRVVHFTPTPVGNLPFQTDFSDYREVNGIKVPFQVVLSSADGVMMETFTHVSLNPRIEASRFEMPKGQGPSGPP